ncbi:MULTISPECIES: NEAT domain-containing protein [unclassified Sporosarcina]|uniref:NEAT domain-containing protein n=1 Tax=unclassified Sporosarcina TaxID=2647733 RepID=UPI000C16C5E2|nr:MULTISPECIES: NEAT domain-containing protein [unclassified Sporosarcina]PID06334.1 S-layer protein [Sporosarcina sp. P30]PID09528.1 S-layer protein [Sporosarcina sp. P31]PID12826.1 S-layer protein [Sporosarcina sp. P32b]
MTKKTSSRATKVVLASLLAASIAIPTAASANPISTSDRAASALTQAVAVDQVIDLHIYKTGTTTPEPAISGHLVPQGTLVEKDGVSYAKVTVAAKSAPMIAGLQTKQGEEFADATVVKNTDGTTTYTFPVVADKVYPGKIHVVYAPANMDKWYEFDFKATVAKADIGTEEISKIGVKVYKDGTKEDSIMNDYMSPVATSKKVENGNEVTVKFPKGSYIHGFKIAGKEVPVATDDKSTGLRTYKFNVADLTKSLNAEIHVIVNEGPIKYDSNHKVQIAFSKEANPFKDIDKDGNKAAILALFDKDIVKEATNFNPRNNITRSQFALMVARALNLDTTKDVGFKDLGKITDKERISAINALAEAGIVQTNEKFNPNDTLTRQQGALMLYRAIQFAEGKEIKKGDTTLPFYADGKAITDPEAKQAFALLYAEKIMTGAPQSNGKVLISSGSSLQRTQMAKILYGSLEFMNK